MYFTVVFHMLLPQLVISEIKHNNEHVGKYSWAAISLWHIFEIISGKFPHAGMKLFQAYVDEGWNNFEIHCVSHKAPTFELSVTLSNLNWFFTAGTRMKFATKPKQHYPPHLRYVATLPWEIKNSNFLPIISRRGRKCTRIA